MLYGQIKLAGMFSEQGIGYNTDTKIKGLPKPSDEQREKMKASPALAALLTGIPNMVYGGIKDVKNMNYTGLDRLNEIDPGKFSWDRGDFYGDRSLGNHISTQALREVLPGVGIGALAGGAGGAAYPYLAALMKGEDLSSVSGGDVRELGLQGAGAGAVLGGTGGLVHGSYRGAKNYNERVIDKL